VFNLRLIRARAHSELGHQDLAEVEVEAIRTEAESLGYLTQLAYSLSGLAAVAAERRQWAACAGYARQASELAERLGNNLVLGHTLATLGSAERQQAEEGGSLQLVYEALEHGRRSIEVLERIPPSDSLVLAHAYLAEAYLYLKRGQEAVTHYDKVRSLSAALGLKGLGERIAQELESKVEPYRGGGAALRLPAQAKPTEPTP